MAQIRRILMVDDEIIILKTLAVKLAEEGFDITTANSGEKAAELLNNLQFDLVITDLMMEGLDGIKVLKKSKKVSPNISVIILTGYGDLTSAIDALRLGADDYLLKPCDIDELLFRISKCFEKQDLKKKVEMYEDILPVCMVCKKIRADSTDEPGVDKWMTVDQYLTTKAGKSMSHGYCPDCGKKYLAEIDKKM